MDEELVSLGNEKTELLRQPLDNDNMKILVNGMIPDKDN